MGRVNATLRGRVHVWVRVRHTAAPGGFPFSLAAAQSSNPVLLGSSVAHRRDDDTVAPHDDSQTFRRTGAHYSESKHTLASLSLSFSPSLSLSFYLSLSLVRSLSFSLSLSLSLSL